MTQTSVNLGLIGLGAGWEARYRPALSKLEQRWRVIAVVDEDFARAEHGARDLSLRASCGATALARRNDVQGLVWLAAGWAGAAMGNMLRSVAKPVLIAPGIDLADDSLATLADSPNFLAAFPRRCTPVSLRLQELMATQLGRPLRIEVSLPLPERASQEFATPADLAGAAQRPNPHSDQSLFLDWIDWCLHLFRSDPQSVTRYSAPRGLTLELPPLTDGPAAGVPRLAEVTERTEPGAPEVQVLCERGSAVLRDANTMEWTLDEGLQTESLAAERPGVEVMLDHFCRRILGGLIPMPGVPDILRARRIVNG